MKFRGLVIVAVLAIILICPSAFAQSVPFMISYQGKLADSAGDPITALNAPMVFSIYGQDSNSMPTSESPVVLHGTTAFALMHQDLVPSSEYVFAGSTLYVRDVDYVMNYPAGTIARTPASRIPNGGWVNIDYWYQAPGVPLWSESQNVDVAGGIFNVTLGDGDTFPVGLFWTDDSTYLEVSVYGETLSPRARFLSVPYAMTAARLQGYQPADFAQSYHEHVFGSITGSAMDAQVPNNITINMSQDSQLLDGLDGAAYVHVAGDTVTGALQINGGLGLGRAPDATCSIINHQATAPSYGAKLYGSQYGALVQNKTDPFLNRVYMAGESIGLDVAIGDSTDGYIKGAQIQAQGNESVYGTISSASSYGTTASDYAYGGRFTANGVGQGIHYGVSGVAYSSSTSTTWNIGVTGWAETKQTNGTAFGGHFSTGDNASLGTRYGVFAEADNNDAKKVYGVYGAARSYNAGSSAYGGYFSIPFNSAAGFNAAIYATTLVPGSYAGYFDGGKVQIGAAGTPTKIDGSGDLYVGDELEVKGDYYYSTDRTRYFNVPLVGSKYMLAISDFEYDLAAVTCQHTNCGAVFAVVLPERAKITGFRMTGYNNLGCESLGRLSKKDLSAINDLAEVESNSSGSYDVSDTTIILPNIEPMEKVWVYLESSSPSISTWCHILNVVVTYTVDGPE